MKPGKPATRRIRRVSILLIILLGIEFLDELVYGAWEAAWPFIRDDLSLTYVQIGLLMGVPSLVSVLIEPVLGILSDIWKRRLLILGGGCFFTASLILTALSQHFWLLLLSFTLFYPASGAFVSLSQTVLMDSAPDRHEQNMARWTFAGSLGVVAGPLVLSALVAVTQSWRAAYVLFAALTVVLLLALWRLSFDGVPAPHAGESLSEALRRAAEALKSRAVWRWLILLEFSDLMLDVLYGYLALYFVDVAGFSKAQAGLAVAIWAGVGLVGDFLLIPLLERVRGLDYLRISAVVELVLFPAFLLIPWPVPKLAVLGLLGLFNAGWYAILKGKFYDSMPGQSGTAVAVGSVSGVIGSLIPIGLGLVAENIGLRSAIWLLVAGPVALLIGLPGRREEDSPRPGT